MRNTHSVPLRLGVIQHILCVWCRLYVDSALDSLLHLHERSKWTAPNGAQGDPTKGSDRPKYASVNLPHSGLPADSPVCM